MARARPRVGRQAARGPRPEGPGRGGAARALPRVRGRERAVVVPGRAHGVAVPLPDAPQGRRGHALRGRLAARGARVREHHHRPHGRRVVLAHPGRRRHRLGRRRPRPGALAGGRRHAGDAVRGRRARDAGGRTPSRGRPAPAGAASDPELLLPGHADRRRRLHPGRGRGRVPRPGVLDRRLPRDHHGGVCRARHRGGARPPRPRGHERPGAHDLAHPHPSPTVLLVHPLVLRPALPGVLLQPGRRVPVARSDRLPPRRRRPHPRQVAADAPLPRSPGARAPPAGRGAPRAPPGGAARRGPGGGAVGAGARR